MTGWAGAPRLVGWLVALGWVTTVLAGALTGSHPSTLAQLEADIRAGQVEEVRANGGLPPDSVGHAGVELRWRSGWFEHHATAIEATPGQQSRQAERQVRQRDGSPAAEPSSTPVVDPGLRDRLAATGPGVRVVEGPWRSSTWVLLDREVSSWVALAGLSLWFLTLALVVYGPAPRRATRAAWSWLLILAAPVGVPAYLLLGGPLGLRRAPLADTPGRQPRGLTGGWAFLLGLVLAGALNGG